MLRTISKAHSYEELRGIVIDILTEDEKPYQDGSYLTLVNGVANVLVKRGAPTHDNPLAGTSGVRMQSTDIELVRDVFLGLVQTGNNHPG